MSDSNLLKEERRSVTVLERYSMEILALGVFGLLSWIAYTTYTSALTLNTISAKMEASFLFDQRMSDNVDTIESKLLTLETRVQRVEDTKTSKEYHNNSIESVREWVRQNFEKKIRD